jgi:adenylosuccinate lyase
MIPRYTRPEMGALWTEQNKFATWLKVELAVCEAWAERGVIPETSMATIREKAAFDIARIDEIEAEVRHDVIAFLTSVAEFVGPDSRFIHLGMTSSDVVDTALACLMKRAGETILAGMDHLLAVLKKKAHDHKMTVCIGRSHGIHGEPTTFGLKMARFHDEIARSRVRFATAVEGVSFAKLSGAVGTYANLPPEVEAVVAARLGLKASPISTQVLPRDRHAEYMSALAIAAASIENIAVELRHLQRTEVLEAEEKFHEGQKGSSAMPHKRNPITAENLTGLARIVKANLFAALDNVALWHERDISHSSVERVIIPDTTIAMDTMLARAARLVEGLTVYEENMTRNLNLTNGLIFSQKVLLDLIRAGLTREDAYLVVQESAMRCWREKTPFADLLWEQEKVREKLTREQLDTSFDLTYHLKYVDRIFDNVFGER